MKIAICDDDYVQAGALEKIVASCFQNDATRFDCQVFSSAEKMLRELSIDPLAFHVYLLDIEMGEINGLQAAATIREKDINAEIIFITSHAERMQEAFDVKAFHYLLKPIDSEKTRQVLLRCIGLIEEKQSIFRFTVRKTPHSLYYSQIEYFESRGKEIYLHLNDGSQKSFYEKLDTQEKALPMTGFARVHKSYIVNLDCVETVSQGHVWMRSGQSIPVSRTYHLHFNQRYRDYIVRRQR